MRWYSDGTLSAQPIDSVEARILGHCAETGGGDRGSHERGVLQTLDFLYNCVIYLRRKVRITQQESMN